MDSMELKNVTIYALAVILIIIISSGIGLAVGFFIGNTTGYDIGVNAGINYVNCVTERTPIYSTIIPDYILDECWGDFVYAIET